MVEARSQNTAKSWEEFVRAAARLEGGGPLERWYIYRGHADDTWDLHPSLLRYARRSGMSAEAAIKLEKTTQREFMQQAHLYLPQHKVHDQGELSAWWVLMQSYSCPTRTLDWTKSPFVALYFAVEQEPDKDGAVWLVHIKTVETWMAKTFRDYRPPGPFASEKEHYWHEQAEERLYILEPNTLTDRMGAQQYAFTISQNVLCDHGDVLRKATEDRSDVHVFSKIIIPASLKPECLRRLREMNVTARALFPGIDGLGRSGAELIKLASWYPTAGGPERGGKDGE